MNLIFWAKPMGTPSLAQVQTSRVLLTIFSPHTQYPTTVSYSLPTPQTKVGALTKFYKGSVVRSGKKATHKCPRIEGGLPGPSTLQGPVPEPNSVSCDGQLNSGSLHQQTRRNSLSRDVCSPVEDHDLVPSLPHNIESQAHSRVPECDGRPTVQVQPSAVNRMVSAPAGVQTDLPEVVHTSCRLICHSPEPQTSTIRISCPRPKGLGHRCSKHKLDQPHGLCLPSYGSPSQGDPKDQAIQSSRNLPKWNLSVVLNELTKAPFEPMKDTDLKHLTLKNCFLASFGLRQTPQRNPCLGHKVSNLGQWEKVALFPSSDFIAKNQLAREGSQSVSPVTIPTLTTIVDRQFKEDRTLCPVWALRCYLDRTKDLRGSRSLLFISFKKGHTSDSRPATLSSWLKQPSYFVTNKQTNKPWTWSKLKRMISGLSRPLRPFTVGYRWTKSCKPVTGKLTTHLQIFT